MDKDDEFGVKMLSLIAAALTHQGSNKPDLVMGTAKKYERNIRQYFDEPNNDD